MPARSLGRRSVGRKFKAAMIRSREVIECLLKSAPVLTVRCLASPGSPHCFSLTEGPSMQVLLLNNTGSGYADYVEVAAGTTISQFLQDKLPGYKPGDLLIDRKSVV